MLVALIGNFGTWEVLIILLVALMVFGPGKLPEVARTIGKTLGEVRKYTSGMQKEFQDAMDFDVDTNSKKAPFTKTVEKTEDIAKSSFGAGDSVNNPTIEAENSGADTEPPEIEKTTDEGKTAETELESADKLS